MDQHSGSTSAPLTGLAAASALAVQHQVDPRVVLSSIGEAVYDWDIATDGLSWSGNALSLFEVSESDRLATGSAFNRMMDPISPSTRAEAILLTDAKDAGSGVPYRVTFAVQHGRNALLWFEDTGRWFAGADGTAAAAHGVVRRIEGPSQTERREIASSKFDELTGAFLRGPFLRIMADDLVKAEAKKKSMVLLLITINDLSYVNKVCGFAAADEVIAGVAQCLRATIRGKDRLVRYSGTRLGVLLTLFDNAEVHEAAARIMAAVSAHPIRTSAGPIAVSLHVGSVTAPRDGRDTITLLRHAEEALSEARRPTGPDFIPFTLDLLRQETRRRNLSESEDVLRALNERRVLIALEPVQCAKTRLVQFHEALVRVKAEDGSILGAGAIIPVAERFGLVKFVDVRVLELGIEWLKSTPLQRLSVNVSMRTAMATEWITMLTLQLAAHPDIAERLIIEITETAAMADIEATAGIVRQIKTLGARVAIDDFGSGHTSFRSLRALPIDILKIDGVFVQNLARSTDDRFFVRTLVELAKHLGVQTVAEWVQDGETASLLSEWGVDFLQGEFCGHAMIDGVAQPYETEHPAEQVQAPLRAAG